MRCLSAVGMTHHGYARCSLPRLVPTIDPCLRKDARPVPALAELVDAVIGVDAHHIADRRRDRYPVDQQRQHWLCQLLTWAFEHTPGPRLVMSIEGTRSYGGGVAGAAATAGLTVIERKKPTRTTRRGKGTSDPIDAHLAVLTALQLHADNSPTPTATAKPAASRPYATPKSSGSLWLLRRPPAPSRPIAPSWPRSTTTWSLG
jgi:hypothetical protein